MLKKRILEIDVLKILAILLMIIFHIIYDLNEFVNIDVEYSSGMWYWIGKSAAFLFIFLAGINSGFSRHCVRRGVIVFSFGMLITLVTFIFFRSEYIKFGILHLLGVCMIMFPIIKRINKWALIAISITILYLYFGHILDDSSFMLFFNNFFGGPSLDYYPLFPYSSLFILGAATYKSFYYKKISLFNKYTTNKIISFISRHALAIYLIHQPIILGIIFTIKLFI